MLQIAEHSVTRMPLLVHEKNRHEQDVWNFPIFSFLSFLFFVPFLIYLSFYFSADNRKMYKADGKVIARCNFRMDREVE